MTNGHTLAAGVLAALSVVVLAAAAGGRLARRLRQPVVVGEIAAGVLLGPSVLGLLPGDPTSILFPPPVVDVLEGVSQVAIACYMFCVGYEADLGELRRSPRAVGAVALAATAVPLAAGAGLGLLLVRTVEGAHPMLPLFTAVLLSITAVPVLSRVLDERRLRGTPAGVVSLGAATVSDGCGWLLLVLALSLGGSRNGSVESATSLSLTCLLLGAFVLVLLTAGRRILGVGLDRADSLLGTALTSGVLLGSAWFTSWLGLHAVFGALLCGLAAPRRRDGTPDPVVLGRLRATGLLLLPAFFATSGLEVRLDAGSPSLWLLVALVSLVAVLVKLVPAAVGARLAGMDAEESLIVGALMNTRGLTELIAVQVAYSAGVIDSRLYAVFVLMALLTTAATGPLLDAAPAFAARRARARPVRREADDRETDDREKGLTAI